MEIGSAMPLAFASPLAVCGSAASLNRFPLSTRRPSGGRHSLFCVSRRRARVISAIAGVGDADNTADDASSSSQGSASREGRSDDGSRDSEFAVGPPVASEEENELYEFVKKVPPPDLVAKFTEAAPPVVQGAIRQTLMRMLGSLPPLAFTTSVETMSSNLVQLFHSCLISGYMFRNAAYRLELTRSLERSDLPQLPVSEVTPEIVGGTAVFTDETGARVEVPVEQYVAELRDTVGALRNELQRERSGSNELLSFLATMEPHNLEALTANAGEEVIDAMRKVVNAVTASQGIDATDNKLVTASSFELGQLLFYLMVNGFFLREAEVRVELQRKLEGKPPSNEGSKDSKFIGGGSDSSPESPPPSS